MREYEIELAVQVVSWSIDGWMGSSEFEEDWFVVKIFEDVIFFVSFCGEHDFC